MNQPMLHHYRFGFQSHQLEVVNFCWLLHKPWLPFPHSLQMATSLHVDVILFSLVAGCVLNLDIIIFNCATCSVSDLMDSSIIALLFTSAWSTSSLCPFVCVVTAVGSNETYNYTSSVLSTASFGLLICPDSVTSRLSRRLKRDAVLIFLCLCGPKQEKLYCLDCTTCQVHHSMVHSSVLLVF